MTINENVGTITTLLALPFHDSSTHTVGGDAALPKIYASYMSPLPCISNYKMKIIKIKN